MSAPVTWWGGLEAEGGLDQSPTKPTLLPSHPGNAPFPWFLPALVPMPSEVGQTSQPPAHPSLFSPSLPPKPRPVSLPHFPLKLFSGTCLGRASRFWSYRLWLCSLSVGVGHVGRMCFDLLLQASLPLPPPSPGGRQGVNSRAPPDCTPKGPSLGPLRGVGVLPIFTLVWASLGLQAPGRGRQPALRRLLPGGLHSAGGCFYAIPLPSSL